MLGLASFITLGLLAGFVACIILLAMYYGGSIDAFSLILWTIIANLIIWFFAPFFMDLIYRFLYKSKKITLEELKEKSGKVAEFIARTCEKYKFPIPRLLYIADDNPTAFVFGSGAFNARLVISEGLFTYLNEDEIEAVVAHELGHIKRRDFIIMTMASILVQILYELSQILIKMRSKNSKKGNPLPLIGFVSYLFYIIGTYLLLFLSRTREYLADSFAAEETGNPNALAQALIKIAYGIIAKPDDAGQQRLLNSTRTLGIIDTKAAKNVGTAFESAKQDWNFTAKVLLFDLVSPWAKIFELSSTHPLTGKRIEALGNLARAKGSNPTIDMQIVRNIPYDKEKLYRGFVAGVIVYFMPWILILINIIFSFGNPLRMFFLPAALGIGLLIQVLYKYPNDQAEKITTLEAMSDLYASPVKGKLIELEGKAVGRGVAGLVVSEDLLFQDNTGLIYLNYESGLPILGNLLFGLRKVKKLLNIPAKATGWFFRGVSHHLDLKDYLTEQGRIKSHPVLWIVISATILIGISVIAYVGNMPV